MDWKHPTHARPRVSVRIAVTAALTAMMCVACGGSSGQPAGTSPDLSKVTLRVGDQTHAGETLLQAAGLLSKTPYHIEWTEFASGSPLLEALGAGGIDVGGVGDTAPIFAQAAGTRVKIVATNRGAPRADGIVVPEDSTIRSLRDMQGKRVALAKGSSAHYHLLAALKSVGLTFNDITPVYLQPPDAIGAFQNHSFDAWAVFDPYVAQAVSRLHARLLADGTGLVPNYTFLVSSDRALADQATALAVGDYVQRVARAQLWANAHRQQWATTYAQITGLDPASALTTVAHRESTYVPIDDAIVKLQQKEADAFLDAKLIPSPIQVGSYFDRRFNSRIAAVQGTG
jgi:sulfonate transport system substrate-binding protein